MTALRLLAAAAVERGINTVYAVDVPGLAEN
jgi:hypothetical protein